MRALPDLYNKFVELVNYLVCITHILLLEKKLAIDLENKLNVTFLSIYYQRVLEKVAIFVHLKHIMFKLGSSVCCLEEYYVRTSYGNSLKINSRCFL